MPKKRRWHPSQETDELVFAVCDRFLAQLDGQYNPQTPSADGGRKGAAAAIADWLHEKWGRGDLTREKIYPLFWEAARRRFLFLQPPREMHLAQRIAEAYAVGREPGDPREVCVVNVRRDQAIRHVSSAGADLVLSLVREIGRTRQPVHLGLGAGYSAMMVARELADRIRCDPDCPSLVLHALSAGGFQVDRPQRSPLTYFNYFEGALTNVEFVALYANTVVPHDDYERTRNSPGVRRALERAEEIDVVVTSFDWAHDRHGMLRQFLEHLIDAGALPPHALGGMLEAGWTGDVQFRPYSATGPLLGECPARPVSLLEIADLVRLADTPGKYAVLLARPCGECGALKTEALKPLLAEPSLRVWTHLVLDVDTAGALLKSPLAEELPFAAPEPSGVA